MATLHIIPAGAVCGDIKRHLQALERAAAGGADLGARGPHIRDLGATLDILLVALRQQRDELLVSPGSEASEVKRMTERMQELGERLAPLVQLARAYPA